jgi:hypothetical protein
MQSTNPGFPEVFSEEYKENSKTTLFYEAVRNYEIGQVLTFEQLKIETGFNIEKYDRWLVYAANKVLLREDKKMLKNVKEVGYKIATPKEQLTHASFRRVRAGRQANRGVTEAVNMDKNKMSEEQKRCQIFLINHLASMLSLSRKRSMQSLSKTQDAKHSIAQAEKVQKETVREFDKVYEKLKEIEAQLRA